MEEVGKILPRVLKRHVRGASAPVLEVLTPLWPRVAGKAMAEQAQPVAFGAGTLTLATSNASWATELYGLREEICAAVNRALGGQVVKQIRVRMAPEINADRAISGQRPAAQRKEPAAETPGWSPAEAGAFETLLGGLDAETRRTLGRSFAKYFARRSEKVN
ncbi:MAG TPA: DUF721 domain-containing protein [Terriglobia bacterium]|nr:DUF721 domain-containing protein [Terriglobia bacterium]